MSEAPNTFRNITTLRVGGSVAHVERPGSVGELVKLVDALDAEGEPLCIIGGGSNVLAPDDGYNGTIIIPSFTSVVFDDIGGGSVRVVADAGVQWDTLVEEAVSRELWGLENLSAIPGSAGAAPIQNIGAYGAEFSDAAEWVEVYDRTRKMTRTLPRDALAFGYRESVLKAQQPRFVVLRVSLILSTQPRPNLAYKDITKRFVGNPAPSLKEIRQAVIEIRAGKFPDMRRYGTAGSFFLNPILDEAQGNALVERYPKLPHYPAGSGKVKVSLAWILDNVMHAKGMRVGGAFVWDRQPLVIATERDVSAADICKLSATIQKTVLDTVGITIVPEVTFLQ